MVKKTSSCRFECHSKPRLFRPTGRLYYAFYTSREDDNPIEFTAREYNGLRGIQEAQPAAVCTFGLRTWWWYKLDFYTAPAHWDEKAVSKAIRRIADQPNGSKSARIDERDHARVLGLRGKVTFQDIKNHYHLRMLEYHPDKVASRGPKLRELAEEETKKINAAYEYFCMKYGGKA